MYANVAVHLPLLANLVETSPRRNVPFAPVNFSSLGIAVRAATPLCLSR
jgi:hypothetical protein